METERRHSLTTLRSKISSNEDSLHSIIDTLQRCMSDLYDNFMASGVTPMRLPHAIREKCAELVETSAGLRASSGVYGAHESMDLLVRVQKNLDFVRSSVETCRRALHEQFERREEQLSGWGRSLGATFDDNAERTALHHWFEQESGILGQLDTALEDARQYIDPATDVCRTLRDAAASLRRQDALHEAEAHTGWQLSIDEAPFASWREEARRGLERIQQDPANRTCAAAVRHSLLTPDGSLDDNVSCVARAVVSAVTGAASYSDVTADLVWRVGAIVGSGLAVSPGATTRISTAVLLDHAVRCHPADHEESRQWANAALQRWMDNVPVSTAVSSDRAGKPIPSDAEGNQATAQSIPTREGLAMHWLLLGCAESAMDFLVSTGDEKSPSVALVWATVATGHPAAALRLSRCSKHLSLLPEFMNILLALGHWEAMLQLPLSSEEDAYLERVLHDRLRDNDRSAYPLWVSFLISRNRMEELSNLRDSVLTAGAEVSQSLERLLQTALDETPTRHTPPDHNSEEEVPPLFWKKQIGSCKVVIGRHHGEVIEQAPRQSLPARTPVRDEPRSQADPSYAVDRENGVMRSRVRRGLPSPHPGAFESDSAQNGLEPRRVDQTRRQPGSGFALASPPYTPGSWSGKKGPSLAAHPSARLPTPRADMFTWD